MAAQGWSEWLSGLLSGLWPRLPLPPGSHEACLEEMRVSALLDKERRKPAGQRDEELVHKLRVERYTLGLANAQVGDSGGGGGGGWVEARFGQAPLRARFPVSSSVLFLQAIAEGQLGNGVTVCKSCGGLSLHLPPAHLTCRP